MNQTFFSLIRWFFVFIVISLDYTLSYSQVDFYNINSVREIRIAFKEQNWEDILDSLFVNYGEDARLEGNITIDGHFLEGVGVRYKGYSSWDINQVKTPFNIELDYKHPNQNYQGFTKLKLSNVIRDPSFLREALSYEILRKYMPASLANYAKVFVNDIYLGLYTNVEAVDKIFVGKRFGSDGNSFFKGSPEQLEYPYGENANLAYSHGSDSSGYLPYYKLESEYGWNHLFDLIDVLNNDTTNIQTILNIDRTLWMHAFNYTLVNLDSYIGYSQNYYMYMDDNGVFNPIIWDLNMSFGSFRYTDATTLNLSIPKIKQLNPLQILISSTFSPRPLIKNLLANSTYRKMFLAHVRTIVNENFKNNEYYLRGQQIQSFLDPYVQSDPNKFYSYDDFIKNIDTTVGPTSAQYPGLKDLMEARIAYLDTFPGLRGAPVITEIQCDPARPEIGSDVWITAKISGTNMAILGYRQSSNARFLKTILYDDGTHHDGFAGDSIFGGNIKVNGHTVEYYFYAENDSAGVFSPERAENEYYTIQPELRPGDLVINEIMALNANTEVDQNLEYDSWIEFFNNTSEAINLNGLYLSNDKNELAKWTFPDTVIKSKNYLIVWADNDTLQSGLHSNFSLGTDNGVVYLFLNNGNRIDSIWYDQQIKGKSVGRYPNGTGSLTYMLPSFSMSNYFGSTPEADFLLYPNPCNQNLNIEFKNRKGLLSIEIFNSNGQQLKNESINLANKTAPVIIYDIDVSNFVSGIYFIKITDEEIVSYQKFIITHHK